MIIDFSNCKLSNIYYGGSERKLGIYYENKKYMLKFQKKSPFGLKYNHILEFLGSQIFSSVEILTHTTILGTYNGEQVVACKYFTDGYQFVPFNDVGESSIDTKRDNYQYDYNDIIELLEANKKLTNVKETVSTFFVIYIMDALLGNFDRHGTNWGFLKKNNTYTLTPVFDNGSCLFPQMIDDNMMLKIITDDKEINKRVYNFPTSQIKLNDKKSSYFDVISSLDFEECNNALLKITNKIDMDYYYKLIGGLNISDIHKRFYKTILFARFEKIILYSYLKLIGKKDEK